MRNSKINQGLFVHTGCGNFQFTVSLLFAFESVAQANSTSPRKYMVGKDAHFVVIRMLKEGQRLTVQNKFLLRAYF